MSTGWTRMFARKMQKFFLTELNLSRTLFPLQIIGLILNGHGPVYSVTNTSLNTNHVSKQIKDSPNIILAIN